MREFKEELAGPDAPETDKMDQIRELLHGEFRREAQAKIAILEQKVRDLELALYRRVDTLQMRLDSLSGELASERRAQFDELARAMIDLGERIRRIARD
ncbi:MAG: hypothetical protein F9K44_03595 [Hyphomicrobiaceae bacterium]|nr:MAG: hypothetical protein F9K44_03595 [Hyphomicrobiaceae bacterium]